MICTTSPADSPNAFAAEPKLPLVAAVEQAHGRRVHLSTALRWAVSGCRGVRLESTMVGGRRMTSVAAVRRFASRLDARSATHKKSVLITSYESHRETRTAKSKLEKLLAS